MKTVVYVIFVLLLAVHHDVWNWQRHDLVFGFLPVGLAHHVGISLSAAVLWGLAVCFAWPKDVDLLEELPVSEPTAEQETR